MGPGGVLVVRRLSPVDSVLVGAPGRPLPTPIKFQAVDGSGRPVPAASVQWTVVGTNGHVEQSSSVTDVRGQLSAVWVLGTRASDAQGLSVRVATGNREAVATLTATAKPVEVSSVAFRQDTTTVKLGVAAVVQVQATDPFGNTFVPRGMRFVSLDTTLCTVDSVGSVQARKRGFGRVVVHAGSAADTAWVHPTQVVQSIVAPDTLRFHSLGQVVQLSVQLLDDLGRPVGDSLPVDSVVVDTVVKVQRGSTYVVRSLTNGTTPVILRAGAVAQTVQVVVDQRVANVKLSASRTTFDALSDTTQLTALVFDSLGAALTNQALAYFSADTSVAKVAPSGLATTRGNGSTRLYARASNGVADSVAIAVAQQVARVVVKRDSILFDALQAIVSLQASPVDRLGSRVTSAVLTYASGASSVATVDTSGNVRAIANGETVITATYGGDSGLVAVHVAQSPVRVIASSDSVRFVALGETQVIEAVAVDSLGSPVTSAIRGLGVGDTSVVQQLDSVTIRSRANGVTIAAFTVGGLAGQRAIVVSQVPASIRAAVTYSKPILSLPVGSLIPLSCAVFDRNAYALASGPAVGPSSTGTATGADCASLRVQHSGFDTLHLTAGSVAVALPIVVAAAPIASSAVGDFLFVDSLPSGTFPWAPSTRINSRGQMEVYAGFAPDSSPYQSSMRRWISDDSVHFRYDGVAIPHDADPCALNGAGVENMVVIPRSDGPGWRMFYASGSKNCYGWQVFSAVSTDEMTWVKEPGVRLSNGGPLPPNPPVTPPWPAGEGMWVEQLPTGGWRMIASTYEHILPTQDVWQVTEWLSGDQLTWNYVGPILTTRDLPFPWHGSVYSPTIREFVPGLWRMVFTADNRGSGQPFSSTLWSAVSADKLHWQVEGQLLGGPRTDLFYSSLAGNRLVFLRRDAGLNPQLAIATLTMP